MIDKLVLSHWKRLKASCMHGDDRCFTDRCVVLGSIREMNEELIREQDGTKGTDVQQVGREITSSVIAGSLHAGSTPELPLEMLTAATEGSKSSWMHRRM